MTCALYLAHICLVNPANAYLTAGLSAHDDNATDGYICGAHWCRGPLAEVKLGLVIEINSNFSLDVGYLHRSFLVDKDYGTNGPYASLTWRPWR